METKHVTDLKENLISIGKLDEEGHTINFHGGKWKVSTGARILTRWYETGTLYMTTNIRDANNEAFGHRFWDDQNWKIIKSRKIIFNEQAMYKDRSGAQLVVTKPESEISEFDNLDEISKDTIQNGDQEAEEIADPQAEQGTPTTAVRTSYRSVRPL